MIISLLQLQNTSSIKFLISDIQSDNVRIQNIGRMPDTAVAPQGLPPRTGSGVVSGIGQLLRDPEHYEEISVIGNGKDLSCKIE